jgi:hypothetical protein
MTTLRSYYRQTWWLWLLFIIALAGLAYYLSLVFLLGIPILIAYSVFFGIVRVAEIRKEETESMRDQKKGAAPGERESP